MHERMHEKLIVWQEAYKLCLWIYFLSRHFPNDERFALTSQIRDAAVSVPTNIAEGNARKSFKEKRRFFEIAAASLEELHVEILLARDLEYINESEFKKTDEKINRISYLLMKLRESFK
ncbi:four helix bundle protein [Candidatus Peregrinibacteria bacterium]|nr:four helix bundle protein [Candidatus Peregrinibacteria bacterium]